MKLHGDMDPRFSCSTYLTISRTRDGGGFPCRQDALRQPGRTKQGVSYSDASENCAAVPTSDLKRLKQKSHSGCAPALEVPRRSRHPESLRSEVTSAVRSGGDHHLDVTHCSINIGSINIGSINIGSINIVRSIIGWVLAMAVG